jgi:hypothetical protein
MHVTESEFEIIPASIVDMPWTIQFSALTIHMGVDIASIVPQV